MPRASTRRNFLKATAAVGAAPLAAGAASKSKSTLAEPGVYSKLGVRPVINGIGVVTVLGGSIMPPEVVRAMDDASRCFVQLPELQRRAGARIAELLGIPAAMVTAGCASAIAVAAAACVARGEPDNLRRLPDTTGMKNEVVQQKSHRSGYEAQMEGVGAKIVWVETRDELQRAINDRTAMMFFLNKADPDGQIKRDEWIRIGKERSVPTFNDAASDLPPVENLWKYVRQGFDLVAFSGGKALLGPQCSGLLLGRQDLVAAGIPAISPHGGIGRGMKVGKEEIAGVLAAVERYLKVDHDAEQKELESRAAYMIAALSKIRGLKAERHVPEIANHVPHVQLDWEPGRWNARDVTRLLIEGEPSIAVSQRSDTGLLISVWMMRPSEHRIVTERLAEIFRKDTRA